MYVYIYMHIYIYKLNHFGKLSARTEKTEKHEQSRSMQPWPEPGRHAQFCQCFQCVFRFFNFSIFQFFVKNKGKNICLSPKQTFSIKLFLFCDLYGLQKTRVWHWCGMMQQEMQVLKGFGGQPPVFTDCSSQDIIRIGIIRGREICMPKCTYPHWYTTIFFFLHQFANLPNRPETLQIPIKLPKT